MAVLAQHDFKFERRFLLVIYLVFVRTKSPSDRFYNPFKAIIYEKEAMEGILVDLARESYPVLRALKHALVKSDYNLLLKTIYERSSEHVLVDAVC